MSDVWVKAVGRDIVRGDWVRAVSQLRERDDEPEPVCVVDFVRPDSRHGRVIFVVGGGGDFFAEGDAEIRVAGDGP